MANNEEWVNDQAKLRDMMVNHFVSLFSAEAGFGSSCTMVGRFSSIELDLKSSTFKPMSDEDVRKTIFDMGALKAPGIDELPAGFYQKPWEIVKAGVTNFVISTFKGHINIAGINETLLVLIPEVATPESVNHFRPISLCSVIYKVITKIIASQIKIIMPILVGPNQSSFIPKRQINDNIIIAQEIVHTMGIKKGKKWFVAMKVDLEKAWEFIVDTLKRCGMPDQWVDIVFKCISTLAMRVMFNGNMSDSFKPSRGIRQGDPLSPCLFVLCMEHLGQLIQSKVDASV